MDLWNDELGVSINRIWRTQMISRSSGSNMGVSIADWRPPGASAGGGGFKQYIGFFFKLQKCQICVHKFENITMGHQFCVIFLSQICLNTRISLKYQLQECDKQHPTEFFIRLMLYWSVIWHLSERFPLSKMSES